MLADTAHRRSVGVPIRATPAPLRAGAAAPTCTISADASYSSSSIGPTGDSGVASDSPTQGRASTGDPVEPCPRALALTIAVRACPAAARLSALVLLAAAATEASAARLAASR
jgi:hypothetical protein